MEFWVGSTCMIFPFFDATKMLFLYTYTKRYIHMYTCKPSLAFLPILSPNPFAFYFVSGPSCLLTSNRTPSFVLACTYLFCVFSTQRTRPFPCALFCRSVTRCTFLFWHMHFKNSTSFNIEHNFRTKVPLLILSSDLLVNFMMSGQLDLFSFKYDWIYLEVLEKTCTALLRSSAMLCNGVTDCPVFLLLFRSC